MKHILHILKIALFSYIYLCTLKSISQSKLQFSKDTVLKDLENLYESLQQAHYNVYAYPTEDEFKSTYLNLKKSITKEQYSLLETTNLYQQLTASVRNGHTNIGFPISSYIEYAQNGGTLFPLEIAFDKEKPIVRKNWSNNADILTGDEIVSINDKPIQEVLERINLQISAERDYFKEVMIEAFSFPRYYWQVFGKTDSFTVEIKSGDSVKKINLKPIPVIEGYETKRDEILNAQMSLKFYENTAYLNPGNFSGDEERYRRFIDSSFAIITQKKTENLVIDLRNNQGGDDSFSDYLVSYFADKAFYWNSDFTLKTSNQLKEHIRKNKDTTQIFWKTALSKSDGTIYNYKFEAYQPQSDTKRFTGKVWVLVNRQSHSQSAVTAAQIQDYNFGVIVGEKTGDYPSLYASIFQYELPNTKIVVNISKGFITRVNGSKKEEGVIPDIIIKDYLLDEEDEMLKTVLQKINTSK